LGQTKRPKKLTKKKKSTKVRGYLPICGKKLQRTMNLVLCGVDGWRVEIVLEIWGEEKRLPWDRS
jgi:hypothetical protein